MLLIFLVVCSLGWYQVPSYYGHFSYYYFVPQQLLKGSLTYFQFHYNIDLDYNNQTIFSANDYQHCIYQYNRKTHSSSILTGKQYQLGNIIGKKKNAKFNGCCSIAYYQKNIQNQIKSKKSKLYLVKDKHCNVLDPTCLLNKPYPELNIDNIRFYPQIVLFPTIIPQEQEYLYIADRDNHCIKRLHIHKQVVDIVAGKCGESGFKDGALRYNRLNHPSKLGVNPQGVVFFFDEGNEYIRKITPDLKVSTLLNGACKQYGLSRKIENYQMKTILCHENWVEKKTKGPIQHYFQPINLCVEHITKC